MVSEALRLLRVFHDMKQNELADRLGVSKSYVSEIENGNRTPSLETINKYAAEFRVPVSSIMFFAESIEGKTIDTGEGAAGKNFVAKKILGFLQFIESRAEVTDVA